MQSLDVIVIIYSKKTDIVLTLLHDVTTVMAGLTNVAQMTYIQHLWETFAS